MFLQILLKGLSMLPMLITGVENIFGAGGGKTKMQQVDEVSNMIVQSTNFIASRDIMDPSEFAAGKQDVINGFVRIFNASIWHKKKD